MDSNYWKKEHHQQEPCSGLERYNMDKDKCCLCGGEYSAVVYKDVIQCKSCGLYKKSEIPSSEQIKKMLKLFLLSACHKPERKKARLANAKIQLDNLCNYATKGKLFDVGAAGGFVLEVAKNMGWEIDGNEISESGVKYAKDIFDIDMRFGFYEDLPLKDDDYDAVVMWNTLEHTTRPDITIETTKRILKPGGYLQIKIPEKGSLDLLQKYYEPYHFYEFSTKNLTSYLEKEGFEIIYTKDGNDAVPTTEYLVRLKK